MVPDHPGLRPTGDRARETLFNWLQAAVPGACCLDLFAGTGALGLEALSRGAASAVFVERERRLVDALREIAGSWPGGERMEVVRGDVRRWLQNDQRAFNLVFIDPPFSDALHRGVLESLADGEHLAPDARIYVEQDAREPEVDPGQCYELLRSKVVGEVRMSLLVQC